MCWLNDADDCPSPFRGAGTVRKPQATVIVVDDDASIRRALRLQLQILDFNVSVFQSAKEMWPPNCRLITLACW